MFDLVALGAVFLDQEFRFMGAVEKDDKRIVELAFQEEERGKDLFLSPGGIAVNTAVQAARLGWSTQVVGKVGTDPFSELIITELEKEGVDVRRLQRSGREGTGVTIIRSGRRAREMDTAMITYNGANEILEEGDLEPPEDRRAASGSRGIFFVGDFFSLPRLQPSMADILGKARRGGWVTVLDHGRFRRSRTSDRALRDLQVALERVDVYLPSEREILELSGRDDLGDAISEMQDRHGVRWIAVKRGPAGCRVRGPRAEVDVPAFTIREGGVTALGAGSAFNAAFLRQWRLDPEDLGLAGRMANAAGRLKIMSGHAPTRDRLQGFLEKESRRQAVS